MFKALHDEFGELHVAVEGDDGPTSVGEDEEDLPFAVPAPRNIYTIYTIYA
jgi:hypothetical protein